MTRNEQEEYALAMAKRHTRYAKYWLFLLFLAAIGGYYFERDVKPFMYTAIIVAHIHLAISQIIIAVRMIVASRSPF